jgi:hypothetical protein
MLLCNVGKQSTDNSFYFSGRYNFMPTAVRTTDFRIAFSGSWYYCCDYIFACWTYAVVMSITSTSQRFRNASTHIYCLQSVFVWLVWICFSSYINRSRCLRQTVGKRTQHAWIPTARWGHKGKSATHLTGLPPGEERASVAVTEPLRGERHLM